MDLRTRFAFVLALAVGTFHCGSMVSPIDTDAASSADATPAADAAPAVDAPPAVTVPTPACREIAASCGPLPAVVVRGHATGLSGLDGARAAFAVRYITRPGEGLHIPHGVALGRTTVRDGAFETCVCVPEGANVYPEIVAVVFQPGAATETSRDVARAVFSLRYATLGDEDVSPMLTSAPTPVLAEVALAALDPRVARRSVRGIEAAAEGRAVWAGLVADERPVAAELSRGVVESGTSEFTWIRPGRALPTERLVMVVDRNNDQRCTGADLGAIVPAAGLEVLDAGGSRWMSGDALQPLCDALLVQTERSQ